MYISYSINTYRTQRNSTATAYMVLRSLPCGSSPRHVCLSGLAVAHTAGVLHSQLAPTRRHCRSCAPSLPGPSQNKTKARCWSAHSILTDPLTVTACWKAENSPNQISRPRRKRTCPARLSSCNPKNRSHSYTPLYNHTTASALMALVLVPSGLTEKRCGLIQRSQIGLTPRV